MLDRPPTDDERRERMARFDRLAAAVLRNVYIDEMILSFLFVWALSLALLGAVDAWVYGRDALHALDPLFAALMAGGLTFGVHLLNARRR